MLRVVSRGLLIALCLAPASASAQLDKDLAAWIALGYSTQGAFAPDLPQGRVLGAGMRPTLRARYGSRELGPGNSADYYGFGIEGGLGGRAYRVDFLASTYGDCEDCSSFGVSLGMVFPVYTPSRKDVSGFEIAVIPGFGVASADGDETSLLTATVEVPVNLRLNAGPFQVRPFFSPGYGYGMYEDATESVGGALPFYGYGLAVGAARWEASLGMRKVVIEDYDLNDVLGFSLAFRF